MKKCTFAVAVLLASASISMATASKPRICQGPWTIMKAFKGCYGINATNVGDGNSSPRNINSSNPSGPTGPGSGGGSNGPGKGNGNGGGNGNGNGGKKIKFEYLKN